MAIFPIQMHIVLLFSTMAGLPAILTFFAAGAHGFIGIGIHDEGTNTGTGPATFQFIGFNGDLHRPNFGIFKSGIKSSTLAIPLKQEVVTFFSGNTIKLFGAAPKEHSTLAP